MKIKAWDTNAKQWVRLDTACNLTAVGLTPREGVTLVKDTDMWDINRKDIFLNDIVKATVADNNGVTSDIVGVVIFNEGEYCIETDDNYWPLVSWKLVLRSEIIGNAFDNEDMLSFLSE